MTDVRRVNLPMRVDTKPGVVTTMRATPQAWFQPDRLIIPAEYADATIHAILVGNRSLRPAPIPASLFAPYASNNVVWPNVRAGVPIAIDVSRPLGGPVSAILTGRLHFEPIVEEAMKALALLDADVD